MKKKYDLELKSERAKLIVETMPPLVIRMGIIMLMVLFMLVFVSLAVIRIEPRLNFDAIITGHNQGFALLPYKKVVIPTDTISARLTVYRHDYDIKCTMLLEKKEPYVDNSNIYWKVPLLIDTSEIPITVNQSTKATVCLKQAKTSMLKYIFVNLLQ